MLFLGLAWDGRQAAFESTLIAVYGKHDVVLLSKCRVNAPAEIVRQLMTIESEPSISLGALGQLHAALGQWIGEAALVGLAEAGVAPQAVELTGCRPVPLPGGLGLGDLGLAAQHSGLTIITLTEGDDAETCARTAWKMWQQTRQT